MLKTIAVLLLNIIVCNQVGFGQMKQASHVAISTICEGNLSQWDHEQALLNFNTSTQTLNLTSDLYEMTAQYAAEVKNGNDQDANGLPISLSTKLSISDLDFKTSADNGETFTFNSIVTINGKEKSLPVRYTFFYAPRVAENNLSGAPLCSFRLDFVVSIDPDLFGIDLVDGCNEIILKVQDGLLNKIN